MKFENADIVLITIYHKKDHENKAKFSQIEDFLHQEKSQISHDLKKLESRNLIAKPQGRFRFKEFKITEGGILKAKNLMKKMDRILFGL